MAKVKSKLYRNLKPGDQFQIFDGTNPRKERVFIVTVTKVEETRKAWFTGKRQWIVHGNYPWWWTMPIHAYSNDRTEIV